MLLIRNTRNLHILWESVLTLHNGARCLVFYSDSELLLCYHDRRLAPLDVDTAASKLLKRLRVFALDFPSNDGEESFGPDTARAWSCLFNL